MLRLSWILVIASLCLSCAEAPPQAPRAAVPIKSACTAGSRSPASVGLEVRAGRRHSDARTLFVMNQSDRPRTVRVQHVARVEGPCSGDWARQTALYFVDAATCEPPREATVQPKKWIELQVGEQGVAPTWDCAKLGIALWMAVDDEVVCADAGAWIAERGAEEP
ncbi:MAG: hypothetical protein QM820_02915 [Minicystis sp.]